MKYLLIGRPNVGKSSIFNILSIQKKNIIHKDEGTTRDWHKEQFEQIHDYTKWKVVELLIDKHNSGVTLKNFKEIENLTYMPKVGDIFKGEVKAHDFYFCLL